MWKDIIDYSVEKAKEAGISLTLSVNVNASGASPAVTFEPVKPKPRQTSGADQLSRAGYVALAAIANGSIDAYGKSLNWLAKALGVSRNALYRDKTFRAIFDEYNRAGRLPRSGQWNEKTGSFDAATWDDDLDD